MTHRIERCTPGEFDRILEIINLAAGAYRNVIPDDCFHEPYMPPHDLESEIASGIDFFGCYNGDRLVGVMGIQNVTDVTLIRHAYVDPISQGQGIGTMLLENRRFQTSKPILIGTWKAATWAIAFYEKHEFCLVAQEAIRPLLKRYWSVPEAQISNSCVLIEKMSLDFTRE